MLGFIRDIVLLFLFAWVARGLLGARSLNWAKTILASIIGLAAGLLLALLILLPDFDSVADIDDGQLTALALPLALVATMCMLVLLELLFTSRSARGKRRRSFHPIRAVRRWFGMWARGLQVTRILIRNGLGPLVGIRGGEIDAPGTSVVARRARVALEEAGGMFVKLGQLLVTRPDLLPPGAVEELGKLHADVAPIPPEQVRELIEEATESGLEDVFLEFDWEPLGSASIGQAHAARLTDGRRVVIKVRRPNLEAQVVRDLAIVRWLAGLAERRTRWGRSYGVRSVIEEFSNDLRRELDFRIEAGHATEMTSAVENTPSIKVPEIAGELTGQSILVMEMLVGTPIAKLSTAELAGHDLRPLADALCKSQVTSMLRGKRFHGDPHQGNVMLLDDGRLGLVDFGITERLDAFERSAVLEILVALRFDDPMILFDGLRTIGAVDAEHDPEAIQRALAKFLADHSLTGQPSPEVLTDLLRLTTRLGMRLPSSTTTMFRALATLAGTLETLSPDYPLLEVIGEIGGTEIRERVSPSSISEFVQQEWAEMGPLFRRAPQHLDRIATQLEHGGLSTRVRLFADPGDVHTVDLMVNRAIMALLSVGLGAGSVFMLSIDSGITLSGTDFRLTESLGWLGLTLALVLMLRVLLEIIRSNVERQ